jgi:hypothetical protein
MIGTEAMAFHPFKSVREWIFGAKDLGAGRIDAAADRVRAESSKLHSAIEEIAQDNDPFARMVHNLRSNQQRRIARQGNGG